MLNGGSNNNNNTINKNKPATAVMKKFQFAEDTETVQKKQDRAARFNKGSKRTFNISNDIPKGESVSSLQPTIVSNEMYNISHFLIFSE